MKISISGTGIQYPEDLCFPSAGEHIIATNIGARLCVHCPDLGAWHATTTAGMQGRRSPHVKAGGTLFRDQFSED